MSDWFPLNDCQNPVVLDKFMWALCAFAHLVLLSKMPPMFIHQRNLFRNKNPQSTGKKGNIYVFAALTFSLFVTMPCFIAMMIARVATDQHIGVDLPITLAYSFSFSAYLMGLAVVEHQLFSILVHGAPGLRQKAQELVLLNFRTKLFGTLFYSSTLVGFSIGAVFVEIGPNPIRIGLLMAGNVSTLAYFLMYYLSHSVIYHKLSIMKHQSIGQRRSDKVFDEIQAAVAQAKKTMTLLFITFAFFIFVPPLYTFVYVPRSLFMALATGKSHTFMSLKGGSKYNSDSGTPQVASEGPHGGGGGGVRISSARLPTPQKQSNNPSSLQSSVAGAM